ncbi:unnamed protein product [Dibothriocephalus latus]|uniref:Uncharacterized protein n=1 Tax=Dibothriocephalus latus TaxID=60516 RepID=A0A3P7N266_DIBLA|nr:unnamed protein product [Dibothriocephalus latus]
MEVPVYNENVPPLPPPLRLTSIPDRPGAMALGWAGNYTDFSHLHGSVVFVLQTRFCACKYFDPAHVSPWQTLIMVGVTRIYFHMLFSTRGDGKVSSENQIKQAVPTLVCTCVDKP